MQRHQRDRAHDQRRDPADELRAVAEDPAQHPRVDVVDPLERRPVTAQPARVQVARALRRGRSGLSQ